MTRGFFFYLRLASFVGYLLSCLAVAIAAGFASIPSVQRRLQGSPVRLDGNTILGTLMQGLALATTGVLVPASITAGAWQLAIALVAAPASAGLLIACAVVQPKAGSERLVTEGPFALVRHPMYLAFGLLLIATLCLMSSPLATAIAGPLYMTGSALRIAVEERELRSRYTGYWDQYAARVRYRLIPILF